METTIDPTPPPIAMGESYDTYPRLMLILKVGGGDLSGHYVAKFFEAFSGRAMAELLTVELRYSRQLLRADPGCFGMAHGVFYFRVINATVAKDVLVSVLRRVGIDGFARIYVYDGAGPIWRCQFPDQGQDVPVAQIQAELDAIGRQLARINELFKELMEALRNPNFPLGPPPTGPVN